MEKDGKRRGVGSENDQLADTTVEGPKYRLLAIALLSSQVAQVCILGGLVGTLLQLPVVGRLLDEIKNLLRQSLVGLGPCGAVVLCHFESGG